MKSLLTLLVLLLTLPGLSQLDFFVLKKGDRTIDRFYKGSSIHIYTTYDQFVDGVVALCRNDSVYINVQDKRLMNAGFGSKLDQVNLGYAGVALKEIAIIPKKRISAAAAGNLVVRLGIIAAGIAAVNSLDTDYKTGYVIGYVSTIAAGFIASQVHFFRKRKPTGYVIGKKYRLEYIHLSPSSPGSAIKAPPAAILSTTAPL